MIEDGGPAFPFALIDATKGEQKTLPGMTLRDYFAGQALAGMMGDESRIGSPKQYAKEAYEQADAMIAARKED